MMEFDEFKRYVSEYTETGTLPQEIFDEIEEMIISDERCWKYLYTQLCLVETMKKADSDDIMNLLPEKYRIKIFEHEALDLLPDEKPITKRIEEVIEKLKSLADFSPEFRDKVASIMQKVKMHQDGFSKLSPGLQASFFRHISGLDEADMQKRDTERMLEELERIVSDMEKEIDKS